MLRTWVESARRRPVVRRALASVAWTSLPNGADRAGAVRSFYVLERTSHENRRSGLIKHIPEPPLGRTLAAGAALRASAAVVVVGTQRALARLSRA